MGRRQPASSSLCVWYSSPADSQPVKGSDLIILMIVLALQYVGNQAVGWFRLSISAGSAAWQWLVAPTVTIPERCSVASSTVLASASEPSTH